MVINTFQYIYKTYFKSWPEKFGFNYGNEYVPIWCALNINFHIYAFQENFNFFLFNNYIILIFWNSLIFCCCCCIWDFHSPLYLTNFRCWVRASLFHSLSIIILIWWSKESVGQWSMSGGRLAKATLSIGEALVWCHSKFFRWLNHKLTKNP